MKNNRRKKSSTVAELVAITILSATLVVMFVQYCLLKNTASVSTAIQQGHSFLQNNETSTESEFSSSGVVSPEFVGFVSDSKYLTPISSDARRRLISEVRPFVLEVFSDISTVLEFSSETAKNEYINNVISSDASYIYLRFPHDLPASCFVPAVGGYPLENIFHSFSVKDLYIFCSETGELSGVAIDSNRNITSLSVRDRSRLSMEDLSTHNASDGYEKFEFVSFGNKRYPVLTSSVAIRNIAAYTDTEDFTVNNDEKISSVLDTFGFNPNSTSFYRTENALTYVEQTGELSLESDGSINYSSSGGGIGLEEFLSEAKSVYSFEDKIIAAKSVIDRLDNDIFGGYADLYLYSVSYSNDLLTLDFAYMSDGILIDDTQGCARLVFDDFSLTYANIVAKRYAKLDSSYTDIPQKLLFAFAANSLDDANPPAGFPLLYTKDENSVYVVKSAVLTDDSDKKEDVR